jgi:hypothetical protein
MSTRRSGSVGKSVPEPIPVKKSTSKNSTTAKKVQSPKSAPKKEIAVAKTPTSIVKRSSSRGTPNIVKSEEK